MATPIIQAFGLAKHYGPIRALDGVDLSVPGGCLFGFLGPNGAGKTTALRILVGLLRPSGGEARVFGMNAWRDAPTVARRMGYLPGDARFYEWMTGERYLAFHDATRGGGCGPEIARLRGLFDLDLSRRIRDYSRGMKQKLGLLQALMHKPELLILDEPTTGLDPLMQQALYGELRAAAAEGRTVLFSSHMLAEVEALCQRVAIIRGGRIIEDSTIDGLRSRAVRRVELWMHEGAGEVRFPPSWSAVRGADGCFVGHWSGPVEELLRWLAPLPVRDVVLGAPDLEALFATYYGDGAGGRT
jgi:ABC-2 type transport system ATP-binding protein